MFLNKAFGFVQKPFQYVQSNCRVEWNNVVTKWQLCAKCDSERNGAHKQDIMTKNVFSFLYSQLSPHVESHCLDIIISCLTVFGAYVNLQH